VEVKVLLGSQVMRFHFRFQYRNLINLLIFDRTQQATRLEYEGVGVSGGDGDERGELGRLDRKTGTGGGKCAGVSHGIFFVFSIVSFSFSVSYLT